MQQLLLGGFFFRSVLALNRTKIFQPFEETQRSNLIHCTSVVTTGMLQNADECPYNSKYYISSDPRRSFTEGVRDWRWEISAIPLNKLHMPLLLSRAVSSYSYEPGYQWKYWKTVTIQCLLRLVGSIESDGILGMVEVTLQLRRGSIAGKMRVEEQARQIRINKLKQ